MNVTVEELVVLQRQQVGGPSCFQIRLAKQ